MVELQVDGKSLEVEEGSTILEAARKAKIYIPALCADPDLEPYGGCRLCVVDVEGEEDLVLSCNTPVREGMVVRTSTEEVNKVRRRILEILRMDHADDCHLCPKNENCELQEACRYVGVELHVEKKMAYFTGVDESNPFFNLDRNRCILCTRCVRTCEELQGLGALQIVGDGFSSRIVAVGGESIGESICESCGQCVDRCPTAALLPKIYRVPTDVVRTVCPYCGVGCGINLELYHGQLSGVRGDRENPVNRGSLCVKGKFGVVDFVNSFSRLEAPMIRKDGKLTRVDWEEAVSFVAESLASFQEDEVAVIASAKCTNEENYVAQKFARVALRTNNVDHCVRLCHSPTLVALTKAFGSGAMTNAIEEIGESKCIVAIGTNTTETHPVIGARIRRAAKKGAGLIVINPRRIDLCDAASIWLRHKPGTDVALLNALCKVIVEEGLYDRGFIESRTDGFEEIRESLKDFDLSEAEEVTGVSVDLIREAARMYSSSTPASIFYAMGVTQHAHGTDNVLAITNLALLTGNVGKKGSGVNPLRGHNNVQGACDMGALPEFLPGYQNPGDSEVRKKFEDAWGCSLPEGQGFPLVEIFHQILEGKIKALYVIGENPALSEPDLTRVRDALGKLEFLACQDIFENETTEFAHVVLPAVTFAEKDGTFTNTERRVQRIRKAIEPIGESRPDWRILCEVAKKMGRKGFEFKSAQEIFREISQLVPAYGGITWQRLELGGLQWPCPSKDHPGTPTLHQKEFLTENGKAKFVPVSYKVSAEQPTEDYPFVLTTGRSLYQFHTGTMTRKIDGLNKKKGEESVEMNPADAHKLGITDGQVVRVTSRRGSIVARAKIKERTAEGNVFVTFHFSESASNLLTNPALDPLAKIPELKVCVVRIEKAGEEELEKKEEEIGLEDLY